MSAFVGLAGARYRERMVSATKEVFWIRKSAADVPALLDALEASQEALRKAKVALVPSLTHALGTCNDPEQNPGWEQRCFICEGLHAIMVALGEIRS